MNFFSWYKLNKIAAEPFQYPELTEDNALYALGNMETGYTGGPHQNYYMRTRLRANSTAWSPWQITDPRAKDIAKLDSEFAKLYKSRLAAMYREMRRVGLNKDQYKLYKEQNKLPEGFVGEFDPNYDYGGIPLKISDAEHNIIRNGLRTFINKRMIADIVKRKITDPEQQWMEVAKWHRIGHGGALNAEEQEAFNAYWTKFKNKLPKAAPVTKVAPKATSTTPPAATPKAAAPVPPPKQPAKLSTAPTHTYRQAPIPTTLWDVRNNPTFNPDKLSWGPLVAKYKEANPTVNFNRLTPGTKINLYYTKKDNKVNN